MLSPENAARPAWRNRLYRVIFEADTAAGRAFDVGLLGLIIISVAAVLAESVVAVRTSYGGILRVVEWALTILFTMEYVLRLISVARPLRYARSFFGVVDVLAILPGYLAWFVPGAQSLLVIRALRLLRVFRILKVAAYLNEANSLMAALRHSLRKIALFLGVILVLVLILGSAMYVVEGAESGFTSIPRAIYWAIVTMTTVGYGDITPRTGLGQFLASIVMLTGYGILAVPTGIVTAQIVLESRAITTRTCPHCLTEGHDRRARFCADCGDPLLALRPAPVPVDPGRDSSV